MPGIKGIVPVPQVPNENVATLKSHPWAEILPLLGKSGDRIMLGLLLDCGIFVAVGPGKDNFYQLSGEYGSRVCLHCLY